ncbi:MAG: pyrroline-5-carboxylate reductase [Burkholderiales bacterium]|nr:pyrroline-5-carboxylate reductase [Burkholderiales bacterium]
MAAALIGGLIARGVAADRFAVADPAEAARAQLAQRFGVATHADGRDAVRDADVVVLAVKPQVMRVVAQGLGDAVRDALVVTIAAGIRLADLARWLGGHARLVRVMPNTPALVQAGISGAYAAPDVGAADRETVDAILGATGPVVWVDAEARIDAVTAVSGSGPAYVFYLLEAMQAAGVAQGLTPDAARCLSIETVRGAARLAAAAEDPFDVLRARVTSKGGTTEAAIATLDARGVKAALVDAIEAAAARAAELGDALGRG